MKTHYTKWQIDRLVEVWLTVDVGLESKTPQEIKDFLRHIEACGDATEECGKRADEYKAAREYGTNRVRALLSAMETPLPT